MASKIFVIDDESAQPSNPIDTSTKEPSPSCLAPQSDSLLGFDDSVTSVESFNPNIVPH